MPTARELERQLAEIVSLAHAPVPPEVAADVLEASLEEILSVGETLAAQGLLVDSAEGFSPVSVSVAEKTVGGLGKARRAGLLVRLAEALERSGWGETAPGLVGGYYAEAHQWGRALPFLDRAAALEMERGRLGEALPFLDSALEAYQHSGVRDPSLEGRLHLQRARFYREAGQSDLARLATWTPNSSCSLSRISE